MPKEVVNGIAPLPLVKLFRKESFSLRDCHTTPRIQQCPGSGNLENGQESELLLQSAMEMYEGQGLAFM